MSFTDDLGNAETLTSTSTSAVRAAVPGAPRSVEVTTAGAGELRVSWGEPASDGGADITDYTVQWKKSLDRWDSSTAVLSTTTTETTHTIRDLSPGIEYSVRVFAANSVGDGPATVARPL